MYSLHLRATVVFGGYAPGRGHLSDCCVCKLGEGKPAALDWHVLPLAGSSVPRRCYHGAAVIETATVPQLIVFGGQRAPLDRKGTGGGAVLNDTWSIDLTNGRVKAVITDKGGPPKPRARLVCVGAPGSSGSQRILIIGGCTDTQSFFKPSDNLHMVVFAGERIGWQTGEDLIGERSEQGSGRDDPGKGGQSVAARLREQWAMLQRHSHTGCLLGRQVVIFGGKTPAGISGDLLQLHTESLSCEEIRVSGAPPSPR